MFRGGAEQLPSIMAAMRVTALIVLAALGAIARDAATECACDPQKPETMAARQCSLCREAEKQPADQDDFLSERHQSAEAESMACADSRAWQRTASPSRFTARIQDSSLDSRDRESEVACGGTIGASHTTAKRFGRSVTRTFTSAS